MMKFFRKHNKKLLAIFMCLLLVCWLGGDALEYMLRPTGGGGTEGTYVGGDITQDDINNIRSQTEWLERLGMSWRMPLAGLQTEELDLTTWFLLQKEARRMGVQTSRSMVETLLRQREEAFRGQERQVPTVAEVSARLNVKKDVIYDAAAAYFDIVRYGSRMLAAARANAAEVRQFAVNAMSQVQVKALVLRAEMFEDPEESFSDVEIQEQFEKYKDAKPAGIGLNFGYKLPPRVKVQYVKIDPKIIEETMQVDESKLESEAKRYWRGNKKGDTFKRPPKDKDTTTTQATQPGEETESQPATSAATTSAAADEVYFSTWAQARDAAIKVVRRQWALERAQKLAEWLLAQALEPWYHVEAGSDGFKVPPEEVQQSDHYARILARVPPSLSGAEGTLVTLTSWISKENVGQLAEIGKGVLSRPGEDPLVFAQKAFDVQGLVPPLNAEETRRMDRTGYLAVHQTYSSIWTTPEDGSLYLFRPVEVDAERPPRDVEEVREQVLADLRLAKGYQKAQVAAEEFRIKALELKAEIDPSSSTQPEEFRVKALTEGLKAVWDADTALQESVEAYNARVTARDREAGSTARGEERKAGFHENVPVSHRRISGEPTQMIGQIGKVNDSFLAGCFEMRDADAPEKRLRVLPVPEGGTVVVAEWGQDMPLDEQRFKMIESYLMQDLERQRRTTYLAAWLDPEQIRTRNQFKWKRGG